MVFLSESDLPCELLLCAVESRMGEFNFAGREVTLDRSTIAPLEPSVTTLVCHEVLLSSALSVSVVVFDPRFCLHEVGDFAEPFDAASSVEARYGITNFRACSRNSFFTYSLTKMRSGAYGELPPNANRAVTRCSAAAIRSAVRSTTAMALVCGEASCV